MGRKIAYNKLYYCIDVPYSYSLCYLYKKKIRDTQRSEVIPSNMTHVENTSAINLQRNMTASSTVIPSR